MLDSTTFLSEVTLFAVMDFMASVRRTVPAVTAGTVPSATAAPVPSSFFAFARPSIVTFVVAFSSTPAVKSVDPIVTFWPPFSTTLEMLSFAVHAFVEVSIFEPAPAPIMARLPIAPRVYLIGLLSSTVTVTASFASKAASVNPAMVVAPVMPTFFFVSDRLPSG